MSYEGYYELLCKNGHYDAHDAYAQKPKKCRHCGAVFVYRHSVDQTNGEIEDCPYTQPAPKEEIGRDDNWREDHYGNKYAVGVPRYRPLGHWRRL